MTRRSLWNQPRNTALFFNVLACVFVSLSLSSSVSLANQDDSGEFSDEGVGNTRIENEYKLTIPLDKAEEVWAYLTQRYTNSPDAFLKKVDPRFETQISDENFSDTYFDTTNLDMLQRQGGIRYRSRLIPHDPTHPKHGRSLVQIKLAREGDISTNRSEVKFPAISRQKLLAGNYSPDILVKEDQREEFKKRVSELKIDPSSLSEAIALDQRRRRVYISLDGKPFATITLDEVSSHFLWKSVRVTEIEMELNEIGYTKGDDQQRKKMQTVNDMLKTDLLQKFSYIKQDLTPKYNKVYNKFTAEMTMFQPLMKLKLML